MRVRQWQDCREDLPGGVNIRQNNTATAQCQPLSNHWHPGHPLATGPSCEMPGGTLRGGHRVGHTAKRWQYRGGTARFGRALDQSVVSAPYPASAVITRSSLWIAIYAS